MLNYKIVCSRLVHFPSASSKLVLFHVFGALFTLNLEHRIITIPNHILFLYHWPAMLIHVRVFYVFNGSWGICCSRPWLCSNMPSKSTFCDQECSCILSSSEGEEILWEPHCRCWVGWRSFTFVVLLPTFHVSSSSSTPSTTIVIVVLAHLEESMLEAHLADPKLMLVESG